MKNIPFGMFKTPEALHEHLLKTEHTARVMMIPADCSFTGEIVCSICHAAAKDLNQDPRSYSRLAIGFTDLGIQVWCRRCDENVMHMDFEGQQFVVNDRRKKRQQQEKNNG